VCPYKSSLSSHAVRVAAVRVWVDLTNSPHVLVFRPLIRLLRERGADVEVTAREYAQTMQLLELHGIEAEAIGRHGGRSAFGKARAELGRLGALRRWARRRRFDLALAHGSHDLTLTARSLGIPSATTFDYEFAWLQHQLGCRAATRVVVPEAIPADRLARYGARPPKLRRYPGLKEEYYLADFEPDGSVPGQLGVDPARRLVVVRTPPEVSLYHRHGNPLFLSVLERIGGDGHIHAVVLPRTEEQRERVRALGLPSLLVPERAVDAQSLIAAAAVVVSAGGTMNREAVALGTPVYTTFGGRLGAVDEGLIRDGRLLQLRDASALDLDALPPRRERLLRDPTVLLELLLGEHG
jgi:predicted glycosyltransferase